MNRYIQVRRCVIVTNAKYQRVASLLEQRIRQGSLADGDKLPGEMDLARELDVSRGTIRQAIAELQRRQLVSTQVGVGSFVTFDGISLDSSAGWSSALALGGVDLSVEVLGIERTKPTEISEFPADLELDEVITVLRVRRLPNGKAVSLECASVLPHGPLANLPETGLIDGSLTASLAQAGLRAHHGEQRVSVVALSPTDAAALDRAPGTPFLGSVRITRAADGSLVEHVVSSLDPEYFRLHMRFGDPV